MSDIEKSLIIVKPDGVEKKVLGEIISRIEDDGLVITGLKMVRISEELAKKHYKDHIGKPYFERLLGYITRGNSVVMVVEGEDAIKKLRKLMGQTDSTKAKKGTIRGDFGTDITINIIHGSDCPQSAKREIELFFDNIG